MTQNEKDLLLKDFCARLPYGVKYACSDIKNVWKLNSILTERRGDSTLLDIYNPLELCKPYLFPLSSMTDEQKKYITDRWGINEDFDFEIDPNWGKFVVEVGDVMDFINWCYENHLDINSLIPKDLAIDAANKNIY